MTEVSNDAGASRIASCQAAGHDVEVIRPVDRQEYVYRHGPFRFAFPLVLPPNDGSLIIAYERAFGDWLKVVHGSLVPERA